MTQATKHTPTPWWFDDRWDNFCNGCVIDGQGTQRIAAAFYMGGTQAARDNAAHIVRCVNAHDELVAALQAAHSHLCNGEFNKSPFVTALRLKVAAALAKVDTK
jgi:hypothetical protein